jgi:formyl-CoA transferase
MRTVAPVPKLSETPGDVVSPYPEKVGEHTREILRSIGVDDEEIDRLAAQGVVGLPD